MPTSNSTLLYLFVGKSSIAKQLAKEAIESGIDVVFVTGSESSSNIEHWLISNILDQFMSNHEFNIKKLKEKAELERESSSDNSSCPSPLESRATWSLRKSAFTTFEPLPVQESLSYLRSRSKTVRFRDWLMHLSSIGGTGSPSLTSSSATSTASPSPRSPPSPAVTSVSESRPQSVGSGISANTNFGELKMIHGYRTLDLVHLVQDIFHDSCSLTEGTSVSSTPASAPALLHFDPRVKDLLLKALIVRTLRAALELSRTVLEVDNLQWCDEQSTQILIDLITSSDSGFGIFCYRKTPNSMETEQKTFVTLRGISQCITLSSLRSTEVSELAYGIMGQPSRSCLNRERLSRIITRTQGIPGLVESLVTALKDETDRGLNPNIEDIRIPVSAFILPYLDYT